MAKCQFCDKGVTFGIKVSHSHRRSNRTWKPNVKRVKAIVDGKPQHKTAACLCMHSLPAQRQGHPRCVILILPETNPLQGGFFSFIVHLIFVNLFVYFVSFYLAESSMKR